MRKKKSFNGIIEREREPRETGLDKDGKGSECDAFLERD